MKEVLVLAKQISISKTFYINFKEHINLLNELQTCIQIYLHQLGSFYPFGYLYMCTQRLCITFGHFSKETLYSFLSGFVLAFTVIQSYDVARKV